MQAILFNLDELFLQAYLWHPAQRPNDVLLPGPLRSSLEVAWIASFDNCVIKSILKRHNRGSDEEVSEKDDEGHCPDDGGPVRGSHEAHGVLLPHHGNNLLLKRTNQIFVFLQVGSEQNHREEGKTKLHWHEEHHEESDDSECPFNNEHDPVNDSEDSQGVEEVEHIEDDDERVHLVLFHVRIGPVNHIDVLLFRLSIVNVIENSVHVPVVGYLRVVKLHEEENDDEQVSGDRQLMAVPFSVQSCLSLFQLLLIEVLGNHQFEEQDSSCIAETEK